MRYGFYHAAFKSENMETKRVTALIFEARELAKLVMNLEMLCSHTTSKRAHDRLRKAELELSAIRHAIQQIEFSL